MLPLTPTSEYSQMLLLTEVEVEVVLVPPRRQPAVIRGMLETLLLHGRHSNAADLLTRHEISKQADTLASRCIPTRAAVKVEGSDYNWTTIQC